VTTPRKRRRRRPITKTDVRGLVVAVTHLVEQLALLTTVLNAAVKHLSVPARARNKANQDSPPRHEAKLWEGEVPPAADVLPLHAPTGGAP